LSESQEPGFAAQESVEVLLRLEQAIDSSLSSVIVDTETSAQSIIQHVRRLHDSASTLASYLDGTSLKTGDLGKEIDESVIFIVNIGEFIEQLPAKMERDLAAVQAVVAEINTLSELTSDVRAISLQSHILGINAAIEAARAGTAGSAFKVVADEMRMLAGNSGAMAVRINAGLSRAKQIVESGLQSTIAESSLQLAEVTKAAASIHKLRDNLNDMSQYYKTRFAVVIKHNEDLVKDIAAALGQIQYQDVVRQCIERIRAVSGRRNDALCALLGSSGEDPGAVAELPLQLELILGDYVAEENNHGHSERQTSGAPLKLELF